MQGLRKI